MTKGEYHKYEKNTVIKVIADGSKYHKNYHGSWVDWWLLAPTSLTDAEICDGLNIPNQHGGSGQTYIKRTKTRVLVLWV